MNFIFTIILSILGGVQLMYAIKIFHGYLSADGKKRTRDKSNIKLFRNKKDAEHIAFKIGGRVKKIE